MNLKKISNAGLSIIKTYEGFRSNPYLCPAGVPTIGYGATYYANSDKVTLNDSIITKVQADALLEKMLVRYETGVSRYVKSNINQNQFDALVSFAYNLGLGALQKSTLLKKVNANPKDKNIRYQFSRWVRANGRVLKGLQRRRKAESQLYFL